MPVNISHDRTHYFLLIIILFLATIMRLWQFSSFSFSNDELSAIIRTEYDSLEDLIDYGVKKNDFHPAGVQVFLFYWTKLSGTSEAAVRFPFVIAGILSVLFVYLIAKLWFGRNTALFSAAAIAALIYPVLYSQIARPYSVGLFFCMAAVYFWSRLIFENKFNNYFLLTGYILFSALAAYTHHFAFLFMIIVGVTGLFFLRGRNLKMYLLAGVAVLLLYLPHLPVFLYQFGIGGVGGPEGWLGKPKGDWFWKYLEYIFNNSALLILVVLAIVIGSVVFRIADKKIYFNKFHFISLIWFLILYFIGYYYSIYRNPVLQYSILIFSFPFLFIFLFSFVPEMDKKYIYSVLVIFLLSTVFSTAFEKNYYSQQHFGEFKDLTIKVDEWHNKYGSENITQVARTNSKRYLDFYFKRHGKSYEFLDYDIFDRHDFLELKNIVEKGQTKYFLFAWTLMGSYTPEDIIKTNYPCIVEESKYSGLSYASLYSKDATGNCIEERSVADFTTDFAESKTWNYNSQLIKDTLGVMSVSLAGNEFGPTFSKVIGEVASQGVKKVRIMFKAYSKDIGDAQTVVTYDNVKQQAYEWMSTNIDYFHKEDKWFDVINTFKLPDYRSKNDIIKIYLWNVNKADILISDMKIQFYEEE